MSSPVVTSPRLGPLTADQINAALARHGAGELVEAAFAETGMFGQNVLLATTAGGFVLRGCPHYDWQFPLERWFARQLHERTSAPVPWPYVWDPETDIFGWSYALMPRMPGQSPNAPDLTPEDRLAIAAAIGRAMSETQALTFPQTGGYDLATDGFRPHETSYRDWLKADIDRLVDAAKATVPEATSGDEPWLNDLLAGLGDPWSGEFTPTYCHGDFGPGNLAVARDDKGVWQVSGVFDLMENRVGDGLGDLVRLTCGYLERKNGDLGPRLADALWSAYVTQRPLPQSSTARLAWHVVRDRLLFWEYGHRPTENWFPPTVTLRGYLEPALDRVAAQATLFLLR